MAKILIVGAGFSGAVVAQQLAEHTGHEILVIDQRDHIGGNCYTKKDLDSGITEHVYGPHIFNTSNEKVWRYINRFTEFGQYVHRVKATTDRGVFSLPINLMTINHFFNKNLSPGDAEQFIKNLGDSTIRNPQNFEEQALQMIGKDLYYAFFKGYTIKQWGGDPKELPASILKRLPVRFNYDDSYYFSKYQGIPVEGYTPVFERLLGNKNITVKLNQQYKKSWNDDFDFVFYTGPLDAYFDFSNGRLGYRTIYFEKEFLRDTDYQGTSQMNFCEEKIPYTRICEHKHFTPWENFKDSIIFREFSKETTSSDIPYYPKRLQNDKAKIFAYRDQAEREMKITFLGRLGTYRYMDMHHVIGEALETAEKFITHTSGFETFRKFPNEE